ncbi:hypothetical protein Tco_0715265 [Tanacetum coccineum]
MKTRSVKQEETYATQDDYDYSQSKQTIHFEIFKCSGEGPDTVLEEIVDALCQHVSDDSPMMILGVILVWLADSDDSVQLTAVLCLLLVYSK